MKIWGLENYKNPHKIKQNVADYFRLYKDTNCPETVDYLVYNGIYYDPVVIT